MSRHRQEPTFRRLLAGQVVIVPPTPSIIRLTPEVDNCIPLGRLLNLAIAAVWLRSTYILRSGTLHNILGMGSGAAGALSGPPGLGIITIITILD